MVAQNEYEQNRKATGLSKPSIILGLKPSLTIPVPLCFSLDLMHLIMNLAELLISHWRGTMPVTTSNYSVRNSRQLFNC